MQKEEFTLATGETISVSHVDTDDDATTKLRIYTVALFSDPTEEIMGFSAVWRCVVAKKDEDGAR